MQGLSIWNPIDVEVGACARWELGALTLWAERYAQEWHILPVLGEEERAEGAVGFPARADKPRSADWKHYLAGPSNRLIPAPAMIDKSAVVKPDRELIIFPGEKARFFIALPVHFRLYAGGASKSKTAIKLLETPLVRMPYAWFGDPVAGELCCYAESRFYLDLSAIPLSAVRAVCPLLISNESDKELSFDRICVHTDLLGIYRGEKRLWTNEVSVVFKGSDQTTQLQTSRSAPAFEEKTTQVAEARNAADSWHIKRTFNLIKSYTGF